MHRTVSGALALLGALALVCLACPGIARAQENNGEVEDLVPKLGVATVGEGESARVTMDFKSADIRNVLRLISYASGVNIVAGPEVQGTISVRLADAPWQDALDAILKAYGYAYERKGNIIRVTTAEQLKAEDTETLLVRLKFCDPEVMMDSVSPLLSPRGTIKVNPLVNALVINDLPGNLRKIEETIAALDTKTRQVMIEARILEVSVGTVDDLGIEWSVTGSLTGSVRPTTFPFPNDHTLGDLEPYGTFPAAEEDDFEFGYLDFSGLTATLRALASDSNVKIVSCPRVVTMDNVKATMKSATVVPVPLFERNEETGGIEVVGYEEKEVGIILEVTPHVNGDSGIITLEVIPEVSTFAEVDNRTFIGDPTAERPITFERRTETTVMVRDGHTLVISGLIDNQTARSSKKVPLLGSIPVLGRVFSSDHEDDTRTDLVMFITPRITAEDEMLERDSYAAESQEVVISQKTDRDRLLAAKAHYEYGKELLAAGRSAEAAAELERALELVPDMREARVLLERARPEPERVLNAPAIAEPDQAKVQVREWAEEEVQQDQPSASSQWEGSVDAPPAPPDDAAIAASHLELGKKAWKEGDWALAESYLKSAAALGLDSEAQGWLVKVWEAQAEEALAAGIELYEAGQYDKAVVYFRRAMELSPSSKARRYIERCEGKLAGN